MSLINAVPFFYFFMPRISYSRVGGAGWRDPGILCAELNQFG